MVRISNFSKYLDIKNCLYEKRLFSKFVLTSEDKLNTTETSLVDKKNSLVKNSLPYYTNSLVIIWLYSYYYLLFIFSISFYYYYTRHLIKKNRNYCINIKINSVKEIYVKNLFFFYFLLFWWQIKSRWMNFHTKTFLFTTLDTLRSKTLTRQQLIVQILYILLSIEIMHWRK